MRRIVRTDWWVAVAAVLVLVVLNEVNRHYLVDSNNHFGLITTADEASYLVPPANWIHTGVWKDNSNGLTAYFQRSPGYGMMYMCCLLAGSYSFLLLKLLQIVLFACSIFLFRRLLNLWDVKQSWQWIATLIYAFLPAYSGFVYYTLTEAVTPFFLIWSVLEWTKAHQNQQRSWSLLLSTALLILIRPQMMVLVLVVVVLFLLTRKWKSVKWLSLAFLPLALWYGRTAYITGEVPAMHPIYSVTNNHLYRPTHEALTGLFRIWEYRSDVFHEQVGTVAFGDSAAVEGVIAALPEDCKNEVGPLLYQYRELQLKRIELFGNGTISQSYPGEQAFMEDVQAVRTELIRRNRFRYYVQTPARSAVEMLTLSHLNLYVFQGLWRGKWWMEVLRLLVFVVITSSIALTALLLFLRRGDSLHYALIVGLIVFFGYLFFIQRLNEDRYIYPFLPVFLALGTVTLARIRR